jgi:hypothetical protein
MDVKHSKEFENHWDEESKYMRKQLKGWKVLLYMCTLICDPPCSFRAVMRAGTSVRWPAA